MATLAAGAVLDGKYEILDALSGPSGGGDAYLAHDLALVRRVAVKVLKGTLRGHPGARAAFHKEAQNTARAGDLFPFVVRVYSFGIAQGGRPYFAMEFLDPDLGWKPLRDAVRSAGISSPDDPRFQAFASMLSRCMAAFRERGWLHRDLKPENVFVRIGFTGTWDDIKIIDLGLARLEAGVVMPGGTPGYMPPEQIRNDPDPTPDSDAWAAAGLLVFVLTGSVPFPTAMVREAALAISDVYRGLLGGDSLGAVAERFVPANLANRQRLMAVGLWTLLADAMSPDSGPRWEAFLRLCSGCSGTPTQPWPGDPSLATTQTSPFFSPAAAPSPGICKSTVRSSRPSVRRGAFSTDLRLHLRPLVRLDPGRTGDEPWGVVLDARLAGTGDIAVHADLPAAAISGHPLWGVMERMLAAPDDLTPHLRRARLRMANGLGWVVPLPGEVLDDEDRLVALLDRMASSERRRGLLLMGTCARKEHLRFLERLGALGFGVGVAGSVVANTGVSRFVIGTAAIRHIPAARVNEILEHGGLPPEDLLSLLLGTGRNGQGLWLDGIVRPLDRMLVENNLTAGATVVGSGRAIEWNERWREVLEAAGFNVAGELATEV